MADNIRVNWGKSEDGDDVRPRLRHDLHFERPRVHGLGVGHDPAAGECPLHSADGLGTLALDEGGADLDPIGSALDRFLRDADAPFELHHVEGYLQNRFHGEAISFRIFEWSINTAQLARQSSMISSMKRSSSQRHFNGTYDNLMVLFGIVAPSWPS